MAGNRLLRNQGGKAIDVNALYETTTQASCVPKTTDVKWTRFPMPESGDSQLDTAGRR